MGIIENTSETTILCVGFRSYGSGRFTAYG